MRSQNSLMLAALLLAAPAAQACTTDAWSAVDDPNSVLAATSAARFDGGCGLRLQLDGIDTGYVADATPGTLAPPVVGYVARFYLYVGDSTMAESDTVTLLRGTDDGGNPLFGLEVFAHGGVLRTRLFAFSDGGIPIDTGNNGMTLNPGWRSLELNWRAASAAGALDGEMTLALDGVAGLGNQILSGLDNETQVVDTVHVGVLSNGPGASGWFDIDAFMSKRSGYIGVVTKSCSGTDVVLDNATFLAGPTNCSATGTLELGHRVTVDEGANLDLSAQTIYLESGFTVRQGAGLTVR